VAAFIGRPAAAVQRLNAKKMSSSVAPGGPADRKLAFTRARTYSIRRVFPAVSDSFVWRGSFGTPNSLLLLRLL
jgi:hypothetical protein